MGELELVGLHDDGEHLVLRGPGGQTFRLRIDEPLRAAVRRDRPQLEQLRADGAGMVSPREIQARIRAGATSAEVAAAVGASVEHVRRYEGPVLAEREYVAEQARTSRIGREPDSPALGDLVADRLVARGVDVASLSWDAARDPSGPWVVLARFTAGGETREARWTFEPATRSLTAREDEARWLSETDLEEPATRRHLAAVRDVVFDRERPASTPVADPAEPTAALLDELGSRRGRRRAIDLDDAEEFEGFGPQRAFDLGVPLSPAVVPETAVDAAEPTTATPEADLAEPSGGRGRRKGRAKVPSWDEIVFGAKPE